jgi:hypothetical protein
MARPLPFWFSKDINHINGITNHRSTSGKRPIIIRNIRIKQGRIDRNGQSRSNRKRIRRTHSEVTGGRRERISRRHRLALDPLKELEAHRLVGWVLPFSTFSAIADNIPTLANIPQANVNPFSEFNQFQIHQHKHAESFTPWSGRSCEALGIRKLRPRFHPWLRV